MLLIGDFNDEPFDIAVVDHLQASSELDRVVGRTNEIKSFKNEIADYRGDDTFLYNASWRLLEPENTSTFFITSSPAGEVFPNRYQVLDQIVCTRGLLKQGGLRLNIDSVHIHHTLTVATESGRPRPFDRKCPDQRRSLSPGLRCGRIHSLIEDLDDERERAKCRKVTKTS